MPPGIFLHGSPNMCIFRYPWVVYVQCSTPIPLYCTYRSWCSVGVPLGNTKCAPNGNPRWPRSYMGYNLTNSIWHYTMLISNHSTIQGMNLFMNIAAAYQLLLYKNIFMHFWFNCHFVNNIDRSLKLYTLILIYPKFIV